MAENEYLKLLGNRIFWGAIIGAVIISGTGVSMYFGLKGEIQAVSTAMEKRTITVDNKLDGLDKRVDKLEMPRNELLIIK